MSPVSPRERRCPACGSTSLITDEEQGEVVCTQCGLVVETDLMDYGPEWRTFKDKGDYDRVRTGPPFTFAFHDKGLTTIIRLGNDDRRELASHGRLGDMKRMVAWHTRTRAFQAEERNMALAFHELRRLSNALNAPSNVVETAAIIYR
ncbi:transcription initiation factor IIB, partial [Candidatus Bathyarchaeota archaeon]